MSKTWFCSDHHLGHANIIKFLNKDGQRIRPFDSVQEHDETIIERHNSLVRPEDRVYFMGDVSMKRKDIELVRRMNGRKKLIKGNHDIFKLKDYVPYFEDILSYRVYPEHGIIFSHIPVHKQQLLHRFKFNGHGHLHQNLIEDDQYINLCLEHTNFYPVDMEEILERIGYIKNG